MEITANAIFFFFLTLFTFNLVIPFCAAQHHSTVTLSEIQALTSFKRSVFSDPFGVLDGWDESTPLAPCDWRGVVCYNRRVFELRLPRLQLGGRLTDRLCELRELRKLSLHSNNFNGSIPDALSQCTLLRAVYFQYNSFTGNLPASVFNLTNLQILNVAHNYLSGKIAAVIQPSLRFIDLSSNDFSGEMPSNFSADSQLRLINFSYNRFSGEVPASIGNFQYLQYLWLDSNQLYGTLPSAIANCSSLIHLSVEDNMLKGLLPGSIVAVPNLQVLALSRNGLSGPVPETVFCKPSGNKTASLKIVELGFNEFTGVIKPRNNGSCFTAPAMEVLDLHENHIHGGFPSWLTSLTTLKILDISGNFFTGSLPVEIGNLLNLQELRVANNSLSGSVPCQLLQCRSLKVIDFEGNRLSGNLPVFLTQLKTLKSLSLAGNSFSGSIPVGFGNISGLGTLNLSGNNLTGAVPEDILRLGNLSILNLSHNKFSGQIPNGVSDLSSLVVLNLSECGFSGKVPGNIGSLMKLTSLDLSKQQLSGELPIELFGLPNLQIVALNENKLSGDIPEGFSSLVGLQYLNLSCNVFTGQIPETFGFLHSLMVLSLSYNRISGMVPSELGNCSQLQVIQLRSNRLIGNVTADFSRLSRLKELDLGSNKLNGEIPEEISNCSLMITLLLDGNRLTGNIPDSFSNMSNLKYLNLSRNNLKGEIPSGLGSLFNDSSIFSMNENLCGKPLNNDCKNVRKKKQRKLILLIAMVVGGIGLFFVFCCGYIYSLLRWWKRWMTGEKKRSTGSASSGADRSRGSGENGGPKLVMFNNKITLAETLEATRQFDEENVLSRGRYGLVFKATFQDGMVLSIRRLVDGTIDEANFKKEAELLGKVKHRNITVLRGYYAGPPDLRLLVYDYMPNGNLATLLQEASHQDGHMLNWPMLHLIALGIARGLSFLHSLSIIHGDIKPQNVLFDADFEAHLSEFGLEKLITATTTEASTSSTAVGSLGYVAPEAALTGRPSKEADVYSFGIVLLEILTGRKPVMFSQDEEDIVKWVKKQLEKGQISELLEPGLLELDPESSEWEEFLLGVKVGLLCTAPEPLDRPAMADIVFMLEGCRVGAEVPSSADPTSLHSPA
ncbi:putative LRR receptor-like serine/threonine-protein kinase [Gossypium australe]|uniref:Putative LRR receptor-like serine/threonine-protein kinase n=1 Tax=Gossypium australe TaxID=47621 RepID=A0A5B6W539_9ROSI|nr:putative LRR receptor-like serine/threonine-protein kinase [Gossypium australe]